MRSEATTGTPGPGGAGGGLLDAVRPVLVDALKRAVVGFQRGDMGDEGPLVVIAVPPQALR